MRKKTQYALEFYRRLLRLYPSAFRQLFVDEMLEVFALRIQEAQTQRDLVRIILLEVRSLPINLIQAYVAEFSTNASLVSVGDKSMLTQSVRKYQYVLTFSLIFVSLLCLFILLPFFAHGLHLEASSPIANGYFDPKGFFPYNNSIGSLIRWFGMIGLVLIAPIWVATVSVFVSVSLQREWKELTRRQRIVASLPLVLIVLVVSFIALSPLGQTAITWFLD